MTLELYPPLREAAGAGEASFPLEGELPLRGLLERLSEHFGPAFRQNLMDEAGEVVPGWAVFLNGSHLPLNQPGALEQKVRPGDHLAFVMNVAGGAGS
ncbi:MAG: MoaD/ThiS family protein [Nitrospinota bacterium]